MMTGRRERVDHLLEATEDHFVLPAPDECTWPYY